MVYMEENKKKALIYGTNLLAEPIAKFAYVQGIGRLWNLFGSTVKDVNFNFANPAGALFYGILDIASHLSDKVKDSKYTNLIKAGGALSYSVSTLSGAVSLLGGNFNLENVVQIPFDASMAYQLGKDTFKAYRGERDIIDDVKGVVIDVVTLPARAERTYNKYFGDPDEEEIFEVPPEDPE